MNFLKSLFEKLKGLFIMSSKSECLKNIGNNFDLNDSEYAIVDSLLEFGVECDNIFGALTFQRRKKAFKRQLEELGLSFSTINHLIDAYKKDLLSKKPLNEIVEAAHDEHLKNQKGAKRISPTI